jgi:hypothetical protein
VTATSTDSTVTTTKTPTTKRLRTAGDATATPSRAVPEASGHLAFTGYNVIVLLLVAMSAIAAGVLVLTGARSRPRRTP